MTQQGLQWINCALGFLSLGAFMEISFYLPHPKLSLFKGSNSCGLNTFWSWRFPKVKIPM